jgi:thioredoxin reductase (NADPH)
MVLYDIAIIGGGPAGLTAAIYAGRAKRKTVLFTGQDIGGQISLTFQVENYPGFPESITGPDLVERMAEQARKFGAETDERTVTGVDLSTCPYRLMVGDDVIEASTVIIATGSSNRLLGLESEARFMGKGVFVCATCDAIIYEGLKVVAVGGGDSAVQEALDIAKYAKEVEIVHRGDRFTSSEYLKDEAMGNERVKVRFNTVVEEVLGDDYVSGVRVRDTVTGKESVIETEGVLIAIGWTPNSELFSGQLELTDAGCIVADDVKTMKPGVFVAGDLNDNEYRQLVTACGSGCRAALEADRFLARSG